MDIVQCESCGADMIFATNPKSGKHIPLDAKPERRYVLDGAQCRYVKTYTTHFATCPYADRHRNPRQPSHHGGQP